MNLGEIRATIQAHGYGADTAQAQDLLINAVYREVLNHRRWPWLRASATATLTAGSTSFSLATIPDLRDVDAVRFNDIDDPHAEQLEQLRARRYLRVLGRPQAWARAGQNIEIWPQADRDYDVTVDYIRTAPALQTDYDVPVIPEEHHDVLVAGAVSRLGIRERDSNVRQLMRDDYAAALAALRSAAGFEQRQSSRQVTASGVHDLPSDSWGWFR